MRYVIGVALLMVPLACGQQICLTMERDPHGPRERRVRSNSAIIFDKISTSGTLSNIEDSHVDVSLANTTGEIKIKPVVERVCMVPEYGTYGEIVSQNCSGSGEQFFYLSVKASRHPRDTSYLPRSAQLFLLVNGKVPLSGKITQYKAYGGGIAMERVNRVDGLATNEV